MVLGERRDAAGAPVWLVRAYWNPWATLIFLGPVIMGLGGPISLSDRRLRLGVARRPAGTAGMNWRGLLAALAGVLCIAAASDPAERLPDPAQEARARAIFARCPLPRLPERVDRRFRGRTGRRPATRRARAGAAGRTDAEIKRFLTDRYGEFVLLTPAFDRQPGAVGRAVPGGRPRNLPAAAPPAEAIDRRLRRTLAGGNGSRERLSETDPPDMIAPNIRRNAARRVT